jgi:hypothetical protein
MEIEFYFEIAPLTVFAAALFLTTLIVWARGPRRRG